MVQRPDADHVTFDPTRTSLSGYTARIGFDKTGGDHWLWGAGLSAESPGFELNDLGRLRAADNIEAGAGLTYRENTPGKLFHRWALSGVFGSAWNFGWERQGSSLDLQSNLTFKNFWGTFAGLGLSSRAQSDNLTRGGPSMGTLRAARGSPI
ncbi:MAG: DUF5916 domain-containing protein [Gemmatimonadota bacterium]